MLNNEYHNNQNVEIKPACMGLLQKSHPKSYFKWCYVGSDYRKNVIASASSHGVWRQQHDGRDVTAGCIRRMDCKGKGGLTYESRRINGRRYRLFLSLIITNYHEL